MRQVCQILLLCGCVLIVCGSSVFAEGIQEKNTVFVVKTLEEKIEQPARENKKALVPLIKDKKLREAIKSGKLELHKAQYFKKISDV